MWGGLNPKNETGRDGALRRHAPFRRGRHQLKLAVPHHSFRPLNAGGDSAARYPYRSMRARNDAAVFVKHGATIPSRLGGKSYFGIRASGLQVIVPDSDLLIVAARAVVYH